MTDDLFTEIRSQCRRKGFSLRDLFEDYDFRREGTITLVQLRRIFQSLSILARESTILDFFNKYKTDGNQFNYRTCLTEFETQQSSSTTVGDDQLREFGKLFASRGTTLSDCLRDADRHHLGRVTEGAFLGAVGTNSLTREIARRYKRPPQNDVSYIELERDLTNVLSSRPKEKALPAFFTEIARTIKTRRIDIYGVLKARDNRKTHMIRSANFLSQFGNLGLGLSENELRELCDAFSDGGEFDCAAFSEAVNAVEIPVVEPPSPSSPVESVDVRELLERVRESLTKRRVDLGVSFARFDVYQTGNLPIVAFRRICADEQLGFSRAELNAVIEEFQVGETDVDYRKFTAAVNPQPRSAEPEIEKVIQAIKEYLHFQHLRLRPFLEKFDPRRTGKVTWTQLMAAFRSIQFELNIREARLLKARTSDSVDIAELCDAVDPPPAASSPPPAEVGSPFPPRQERELAEPPQNVLAVLAKISAAVARSHIELDSEFRQYQSSTNGLIRAGSFESALYNLPARLSKQEIDTLLAHYTDAKTRLVDRNRFITDVSTNGNTGSRTPEPAITESAKRIIRRLKGHLNAERVAGATLFDAEKAGTGGILPKDRVRSVLSRIGFELSPDEENELFRCFAPQGMPEQIKFRRLLDQMDVEDVTSDDLAAAKVKPSSSLTGEYDLVRALVLIRGKLAARRRKAEDAFSGLTNDTVPLNEFRQRMQPRRRW
jgi:Ca2+-binding EF-hand superfamily protein